MTTLRQLETVIASLPEEEYRQFRQWFLETDWRRWDSQIEGDSRAGNLNFLVREAQEAKREKKLRDL
jgi:hypothetical protein